jgi:hypothetical protein
MNPELFKIEIKQGVESLTPYAREHKGGMLRKGRQPATEEKYQFPPYLMIFTIEAFPGADCPMVSLSAPWRPIKTLSDQEKASAKEAFEEIFPDHQVILLRTLIPGNSAFKMIAIPSGAPGELVETYRALSASK